MSDSSRRKRRKAQKGKGLVPALRFPEFRGEGGWEEHKLEELASFSKGKGISKSDVVADGKQPCIRYGELYTLYNETIKDVSSSTNVSADNLVLSKANDVIIPASGETQEDIATASCVVNSGIALGGDLNIIRSKMDGVFLSYYLNSSKKKSIAQLSQGISVVHLYPSQLKKLDVCIPPPKEQQKIADCLSSLDELITLQTQKRDALKAHKKGLMQQLFPAEGKTQPKLRFPEFRGKREWGKYLLSNFIQSLDAGVSVNSGDRPANIKEFGILKTSAVRNGVFESSENKIVLNLEEQERLKEPVRKDTIIISRMNTPELVGANAYIEASLDNIYLPDRLWSAKPKPKTCMRFIAYILGSGKGRSALSELATGTSGTMKNITKTDVLDLSVLAPSLPEQQKIADCLSSLDALITAQTQKIDTLKSHKKGLLQQLFPAMDDGCMEEVRPGAGREAGLGHAGGSVAQDTKAEVGA